MSLYKYNYVGVYIKSNPVRVIREDNICICTKCNKEKNRLDLNKFCTDCGTQIISSIKTYETYSSLIREIDERLPQYEEEMSTAMESNSNIMIPNQNDIGVIYSGEADDCNIEITPEIIEKYLADFKEHNKQFIKDVEKEFKIKLEIKFGFLSYSM